MAHYLPSRKRGGKLVGVRLSLSNIKRTSTYYAYYQTGYRIKTEVNLHYKRFAGRRVTSPSLSGGLVTQQVTLLKALMQMFTEKASTVHYLGGLRRAGHLIR